jgi:hypothetical protein
MQFGRADLTRRDAARSGSRWARRRRCSSRASGRMRRARSRRAIHCRSRTGDCAASSDSDAGPTIRGLHAARQHPKESASASEAPGRVRRASPCAAIRSAWRMTTATRRGTRSATQRHRRTGIVGAIATAQRGPASRSVKDAPRCNPSTELRAARSPKGTVRTALPAAHVSPARSPAPPTAANDRRHTEGSTWPCRKSRHRYRIIYN